MFAQKNSAEAIPLASCQASIALQTVYRFTVQADVEAVHKEAFEVLEETLLDIEEHLHAQYLDVQACLRSTLNPQVRRGLDKVLAGLKILVELTLTLCKVRARKNFLKRLRQADESIQSGRELVHQVLGSGRSGGLC